MTNRFDDASKEAADATDESLSDSIWKLENIDKAVLDDLIIDAVDREKVDKLIADIKAVTDKNKKVLAFKKFAESAGKGLVRVVKDIVS